MGLLDDAIRDHLDLKRRRGADPADIQRAEHEALGPVRRDPFEHGADDFESASTPGDRLRAYDHEEDFDDERYEEYDSEEEWEEDFEDQPRGPQFAPGEMTEAGQGELTDRTGLMDYEYEDPQPPIADEPSRPPSYPAAGDETMQYDVEEALASETSQAKPAPESVEQSDEWVEQSEEWVEPSQHPVEPQHADHDVESEAEHGAKPDEDVLEETSEFLQDAADHDRLWFEQRRPRDDG
jgi:hypothetical protein